VFFNADQPAGESSRTSFPQRQVSPRQSSPASTRTAGKRTPQVGAYLQRETLTLTVVNFNKKQRTGSKEPEPHKDRNKIFILIRHSNLESEYI
jgi:hypothetical protein